MQVEIAAKNWVQCPKNRSAEYHWHISSGNERWKTKSRWGRHGNGRRARIAESVAPLKVLPRMQMAYANEGAERQGNCSGRWRARAATDGGRDGAKAAARPMAEAGGRSQTGPPSWRRPRRRPRHKRTLWLQSRRSVLRSVSPLLLADDDDSVHAAKRTQTTNQVVDWTLDPYSHPRLEGKTDPPTLHWRNLNVPGIDDRVLFAFAVDPWQASGRKRRFSEIIPRWSRAKVGRWRRRIRLGAPSTRSAIWSSRWNWLRIRRSPWSPCPSVSFRPIVGVSCWTCRFHLSALAPAWPLGLASILSKMSNYF